MIEKILTPVCYVSVRLFLKLLHIFQKDIERYLPIIQRSLGFEFITRLLITIGHTDLNPRILTFFGAKIGTRSRINSPLVVQNADNGFARLTIGNNCHIGREVLLDLAESIAIADNVTISMRCSIITHFDVGDSRLKDLGFGRKSGGVTLQDNVYLGCGVTVLHGVTIGENSLIGAGSIVTADIPPNSVAVGIPAKVVKSIYDNTKS